jgi:hypothetical protein
MRRSCSQYNLLVRSVSGSAALSVPVQARSRTLDVLGRIRGARRDRRGRCNDHLFHLCPSSTLCSLARGHLHCYNGARASQGCSLCRYVGARCRQHAAHQVSEVRRPVIKQDYRRAFHCTILRAHTFQMRIRSRCERVLSIYAHLQAVPRARLAQGAGCRANIRTSQYTPVHAIILKTVIMPSPDR